MLTNANINSELYVHGQFDCEHACARVPHVDTMCKRLMCTDSRVLSECIRFVQSANNTHKHTHTHANILLLIIASNLSTEALWQRSQRPAQSSVDCCRHIVVTEIATRRNTIIYTHTNTHSFSLWRPALAVAHV